MAFFSERFESSVATKESNAGYLNPSSIEDGGEVRFAILSEEPLEGYEIWFTKISGGMTKRITPDYPDDDLLADLETEIEAKVTERDGRKAIKFCAAFFVYDYSDKLVKVFSANQKTLLSDINRNVSDEDYKDLAKWDMKIGRTGKNTDTKYHCSMVPTRRSSEKVAKEVFEAWDKACAAGADIEALYDGGNPFGPQK